MEQALEKAFSQCLVKHRIAHVTHADMVAHLVCNEFEAWQWLDLAVMAGLNKWPWWDRTGSCRRADNAKDH